jgi:glucose/arabinose dehydrogenase
MGLTDIALDPEFESNRLLYLTYYAPPDGEPGGPPSPEAMEAWQALSPDEQVANPIGIYHVAKARLTDDATGLENVEVLLDAGGRRLVYAPDGTLFATTSGAQSTTNSLISEAQDLSAIGGKVFRVNRDGSIPRDNPDYDNRDALPAIYSIGHRDPEGAAINPLTGELWMVEHGPRGGDELNIIRAGRNYGWPLISYGNEYSTAPIGDGLRTQDGLEQPIYFWVPSIAPSGMLFYTGDLFPEWQGDLFVGSLVAQHLTRLVLDGDRVVAEERLLVERGQRIRDVRQGPDGALYLLTSIRGPGPGSAEVLKITPN